MARDGGAAKARPPEEGAVPAEPSGWGEAALFKVALLAAVVVLAAIAAPMFSELLYTKDDLASLHIPIRSFYSECLADGTSPSWMPSIWCGYWLHGEGEAGMLHPLHRLLYGYLDFTWAFNIELFLSYPVMLAGMYFFLLRWKLRRDAALFGALVFAVSGFNMLHLIHMQAIAVLAHLPWLLLAIDVSVREAGRRRAGANLAIAILTGSQLLLGHPQAFWFSSLAEVLYALFLIPYWRLWPVVLVGLAKALGVVTGAAQLLPTYYAFTCSARNVESYSSTGLSLHPANLVQFVAPYLFDVRVFTNEPSANTHEYGLYDSAVVFVLFVCLFTVLKRLPRDKRRLAKGVILFTVGALVLSLGKYGGLYLLLSKLPLVSWFRAPARYIALVHTGMAVGAALAFDALSRGGPGRSRALPWVLSGVVLTSVVALFLSGWPAGEGGGFAVFSARAETNVRLLLFGPMVVFFSAVLVMAASRGARLALAGLVIVAAADLAFYGLSYVRSSPPVPVEVIRDAVQLPSQPGFFRIESFPTTDNVPTMNGFSLTTGYIGLNPSKELDYTEETPLRLASTAYRIVKSDATDENGAPVGRAVLEPVPSPLPRVRMMTRYVAASRAVVLIESIDVETCAIVDRDIKLTDTELPGTAAVTNEAPGRITVSTDTPSRQLLVVSESFHAGWRATVDGVAAEAIPVYGDFIGVVVEAGRHEVKLVFDHPSERQGLKASVAGAAVALAVFAVSVFVVSRRGGAADN